ncbi:YdcH family protein [Salipiger sp.]|uniref:YdcH family protein n=1 Tax=Salipiger sp. TaxID=2078585 RepID=UPI003A98286D
MSHVPHELAEEFPELAERMSELKGADRHFAELAEAYHRLNRQVHRAETRIAPMEALAEEDLRKQRAALKDRLHAMLTA